MFMDEETFMLPLFGLWQHTADGLPPDGCIVIGYNLIKTGGCAVCFMYCEYELDDDTGEPIREPVWHRCVLSGDPDEDTELAAPIAWAEVRFNFPSQPLGRCDDCGGYFKGLNNPCDKDRDDD